MVFKKVVNSTNFIQKLQQSTEKNSQVPRQLVRSAVIYVLSISVCSALWDVGSYQTLMNCISCLFLQLMLGVIRHWSTWLTTVGVAFT